MEKILILALLVINVQLVFANCSSETASACSEGYNACVMAAGTNSDQLCNCFGSYYSCLLNNDCITSEDFQGLVSYCESNGCSAQQCSGGIVAAPSYAPQSGSEPVSSTPGTFCFTPCLDNFNACANSNGTEGSCSCYGVYLACSYDAGCFTESEYQIAVQSCEQIGCSSQQCSNAPAAPSSSPTSSSPVSVCNSQNAAVCADGYQSCVIAAGTDVNAICSCYGPYFMCLFDVDCLTVSQYQSVVQSCSQSGCTLEQCSGNSTVIAPFSVPPVNQPISSTPTTSGCNSQNAAVCADGFQSCVIAAGTDVNAICNCYSPYFMCLFDINCLTISQYQSIVQTCTQSGCTLEQCTGNSTVIAPFSVPPVNQPISSTPTSIPVGAPISAPFSPPASVICLQPWELVLLVVGSLLAGVGIAAIIGAIIYLSRRSSAKKSAKYAKLQNY